MDTPLLIDDKVIKVGKKNLVPETIFENQDFTLDPSINLDDLIVISSPLKGMGRPAERTLSDGRAVGFEELGLIKDENGIVYNDILVKGVGGSDSVMNIKMEIDKPGPGHEVVTEFKDPKSGRKFPRRFVDEKIRSITGNFGYSLPDRSHLDYINSEKLARYGLRTRRLIFSGEYSSKVPFSTQNGVEKDKELGVNKLKPIIELWAMRCRYRLRDIQRHIFYELDFPFESKVSHTAEERKIEATYSQRLINKSKELTDEKKGRTEEFMAQEIFERIEFEEDNQFSLLYLKFKDNLDLSNKEQVNQFLKEYFLAFAEILGGQVGLMYHLGAFSHERLLNNQNVTLLAEIVDHDVTHFDELSKSSLHSFFYQITQTWESLTLLVSHFIYLGIINENEAKAVLDKYIEGFIKRILKINNAETNNILFVIFNEQFEDIVTKPLPGDKTYDFEISSNDDLEYLIEYNSETGNKDKAEKFKLILEERKSKMAWDFYNKRWCNKEDYVGSGNFYYLATKLRDEVLKNLKALE